MKHLKKMLFMKQWLDTGKKDPAVRDLANCFSNTQESDTKRTQTMDNTFSTEANVEEAPWRVGTFSIRRRVSPFLVQFSHVLSS
jgi:hypothetical protein